MPKGGARPRSGPPADPNSRTSERARRAAKKAAVKPKTEEPEDAVTTTEFNPTALPARGRGGNPPPYPLPKTVRYVLDSRGDGKPTKVSDDTASTAFRKRELAIWREVWKTPQAVAWERDPWRWSTIAKYCRIAASTELEPDASAALLSRERELRNEIGLSPDGLRMNGWAIAPDQLAAKRAERSASAKSATKPATAPVRRLRG